ncbi:hypothetical protein LNQ03_02205 [Klebsiella pneumoniae subsp. pneumoniae]|nr:hypothetical protein [Klebsiella pneumoniae subsp. pneumoniae]
MVQALAAQEVTLRPRDRQPGRGARIRERDHLNPETAAVAGRATAAD